MQDFQDFKAQNMSPAGTEARVMAVFGRKSDSAADDSRYRREAAVAHEATMYLLERYHDWLRS